MTAEAPEQRTQFEADQTSAIYPKGVERHWWSFARNRIIERSVRRLTRSGERVLEIGCGTGVVVDHLSAAGLDVSGCDLARAEPATERVRSRVRLGVDAFGLDLAEREQISGVLLLDVLEHLPEPRGFVERIRDGFPNARWLFVTVPARQELWSNYDEFNDHYKRYAIQEWRELAPEGTRLLEAGYFFHALWLPARILTLLKRDRSTTFRAPHGPSLHAHTILGKLFEFESRVLPGRVPGSSLKFAFEFER